MLVNLLFKCGYFQLGRSRVFSVEAEISNQIVLTQAIHYSLQFYTEKGMLKKTELRCTFIDLWILQMNCSIK